MRHMSPIELSNWLSSAAEGRAVTPVLVDVREPMELAICAIDGAVSLPMSSITARFNELDPAAPTVLICHHGMRSAQVGYFLEQHGFRDIVNLQGGVALWAEQVDPSMPTY
jgi:rhodanese-related sulfurtransferase